MSNLPHAWDNLDDISIDLYDGYDINVDLHDNGTTTSSFDISPFRDNTVYPMSFNLLLVNFLARTNIYLLQINWGAIRAPKLPRLVVPRSWNKFQELCVTLIF